MFYARNFAIAPILLICAVVNFPVSAQQLPGVGKAPDSTVVFAPLRGTDPGTVAASTFPTPIHLNGPASVDTLCASPEIRDFLRQLLEAENGASFVPGRGGADTYSQLIQIAVENLATDNSADASALRHYYSAIPPNEKLGSLQLCATGNRSRIVVNIALFLDSGRVSGGFVATHLFRQPYVFGTFGGLTRQRYEQVSRAIHEIASRPVAITAGADKSYCSQSQIRRAAARAVVEELILSAGTADANGYVEEFNKLRADTSPTGLALKVRLKRQHPEYDEFEICVVPTAGKQDWLQTFVVRKGKRVGGFVINFGYPGQPAYFGDLRPDEL